MVLDTIKKLLKEKFIVSFQSKQNNETKNVSLLEEKATVMI